MDLVSGFCHDVVVTASLASVGSGRSLNMSSAAVFFRKYFDFVLAPQLNDSSVGDDHFASTLFRQSPIDSQSLVGLPISCAAFWCLLTCMCFGADFLSFLLTLWCLSTNSSDVVHVSPHTKWDSQFLLSEIRLPWVTHLCARRVGTSRVCIRNGRRRISNSSHTLRHFLVFSPLYIDCHQEMPWEHCTHWFLLGAILVFTFRQACGVLCRSMHRLHRLFLKFRFKCSLLFMRSSHCGSHCNGNLGSHLRGGMAEVSSATRRKWDEKLLLQGLQQLLLQFADNSSETAATSPVDQPSAPSASSSNSATNASKSKGKKSRQQSSLLDALRKIADRASRSDGDGSLLSRLQSLVGAAANGQSLGKTSRAPAKLAKSGKGKGSAKHQPPKERPLGAPFSFGPKARR